MDTQQENFNLEYNGTELTEYQKNSFIAILEYTANQLQIVRNDYESKIQCDVNDKSGNANSKRHKLAVRFDPAIYKGDGIYYRNTGEPYHKAVNRLKFDKLRSDKYFLINLLQNIAVNLKANQTWYEPARKTISYEFELIDDEHEFIVDYVHNRLMEKRLTERLAKNKLDQSKLTAPVLQLDDVVMTNAIRLRYTRSWESARQEQLLYQSESKERICRDNMKQCRDDMENERRCYHNMKEFLICRTDDMKIECNNWKQKFEEDYDSVEMDTQVRRDQIEETLKRTVELQNEYDKRQLKMDTYLKMKQDKIDRELNLVKLTKLTILVQAWWRGTMVRNKLGPYKKKKKNKKKKPQKK